MDGVVVDVPAFDRAARFGQPWEAKHITPSMFLKPENRLIEDLAENVPKKFAPQSVAVLLTPTRSSLAASTSRRRPLG
jgi:hypothetical protein